MRTESEIPTLSGCEPEKMGNQLLSSPSGRRSQSNQDARREVVRRRWRWAARRALQGGQDCQRLLQDLSSGQDLSAWEPDLCIQMLRIPAAQNYQAIHKLLRRANRRWMLDFLELDGLGVLLESLERLGARGVCSLADTFSQLECVSCLRAVMNSQVGLEYIVQHREYTRQLANVLKSRNNSVKLQVFELLCALCMYSSQGHSLALDSLNYFKISHGRRYRFDLVVHELQSADTVAYQTTLLAFVNCVIHCAADNQQRMCIRTELYGVGLEKVLSALRASDDDSLQIQLKVFDDSQARDEELQEPLSVCHLFDVLYKKVANTPQVLSLQSLLLSLSELDPNDPESDLVWESLQEEVFERKSPRKPIKKAGSPRTRDFGTQTTGNRWLSTKRRASCTIGTQVDTAKISPALSLPSINAQNADISNRTTSHLNSSNQSLSPSKPVELVCKHCQRKFVQEEPQILRSKIEENNNENIPNLEKCPALQSSPKQKHSFTKIRKATPPQSLLVNGNSNVVVIGGFPFVKNLSVSAQLSPTESVSPSTPFPRTFSHENLANISNPSCSPIQPVSKNVTSLKTSSQTESQNSTVPASIPPPLPSQLNVPPPPPLPRISPPVVTNNSASATPPPPPPPMPKNFSFPPPSPKPNNLSSPPPPPMPNNFSSPPPPPMPNFSSPPPTPMPNSFSSPPPPPPPPPMIVNNVPPPPPIPNNIPPPPSLMPGAGPPPPPMPHTPVTPSTPKSFLSCSSYSTPPPPPPMNGFHTPVNEPTVMRERVMETLASGAYKTPTNYYTLPSRKLHSEDTFNKFNTLPKPSKKMKTVNWTKVPNQTIGNSIWANAKLPEMPIDYGQIDELFCRKSSSGTMPPRGSNSGGDSPIQSLVSLLDSKRSLAVNIFLKQFKSGAAGVLEALNKCEGISSEKLKGFLRILPEKEEVDEIKAYKGAPDTLDTAERFLTKLITVPDYPIRVQAMLQKEECPVTVGELTPQLETLINTCHSLIANRRLAEFLVLLLQLGNYLNAGSYAGNAAGFRLNTLPKLLDTRANKPRMTFLHYAVEVAGHYHGDMLTFTEDLDKLQAVIRNPLNGMQEEVQVLAKSVRDMDKKVKNCKSKDIKVKFEGFLKGALQDVDRLERLVKDAKTAEHQLAVHFCEDPAKFKLEECFLLLADFFTKVKEAVVDNHQRKKQEERAAKIEAEKNSLKKSSSSASPKKKGGKPRIFKDEDSELVDLLMNEIKAGIYKRRSTPASTV